MKIALIQAMIFAQTCLRRCSLPCAAAVFLALASCTSQPNTDQFNTEEPPVIEHAVEVLATAVSVPPGEKMPPLTAEIVDVIDGGPGGEWGVKVDFPNGSGDGCYVDIIERRHGKLLARDEVSDSPDSSTNHMVRFRYRGTIENLTIRVTEKSSGVVLAESEHR